MRIIEILYLNKELLKKIQEAGIKMSDIIYVDLFDEYQDLLSKGEKVSYIVATLATKYAVSERKVYDLIKRFKSDCNLGAVQTGSR